jgi:hypothetical protein
MNYRQVNKSEYKDLAAIHIKGFRKFFQSRWKGFFREY